MVSAAAKLPALRQWTASERKGIDGAQYKLSFDKYFIVVHLRCFAVTALHNVVQHVHIQFVIRFDVSVLLVCDDIPDVLQIDQHTSLSNS